MIWESTKYPTKAGTVRKRPVTQKTKTVKAFKQKSSKLQHSTSAGRTSQEVAETPTNMIDNKTVNEPFKHILVFPEEDEVALFKIMNY